MNRKRMNGFFGAALIATLAGCGGADDTAETAPRADSLTAAAPAPAAADTGLVDPEMASRESLLTVEGLDSASIDALIANRPYANMVEVNAALASLPEAQRQQAFVRLWKPLDLNSASEEEIALVPGITTNLIHEFEEYRPYTDMAQFRREIGKYVDATEVARLEKYVTIR